MRTYRGRLIDHLSQRITHMLNIHKNAHVNNQSWSFLGAYIFGYSVMNEYA